MWNWNSRPEWNQGSYHQNWRQDWYDNRDFKGKGYGKGKDRVNPAQGITINLGGAQQQPTAAQPQTQQTMPVQQDTLGQTPLAAFAAANQLMETHWPPAPPRLAAPVQLQSQPPLHVQSPLVQAQVAAHIPMQQCPQHPCPQITQPTIATAQLLQQPMQPQPLVDHANQMAPGNQPQFLPQPPLQQPNPTQEHHKPNRKSRKHAHSSSDSSSSSRGRSLKKHHHKRHSASSASRQPAATATPAFATDVTPPKKGGTATRSHLEDTEKRGLRAENESLRIRNSILENTMLTVRAAQPPMPMQPTPTPTPPSPVPTQPYPVGPEPIHVPAQPFGVPIKEQTHSPLPAQVAPASLAGRQAGEEVAPNDEEDWGPFPSDSVRLTRPQREYSEHIVGKKIDSKYSWGRLKAFLREQDIATLRVLCQRKLIARTKDKEWCTNRILQDVLSREN